MYLHRYIHVYIDRNIANGLFTRNTTFVSHATKIFVSYDIICEIEAFLFVLYDTKFVFHVSTSKVIHTLFTYSLFEICYV
jgi:hypothetical protein